MRSFDQSSCDKCRPTMLLDIIRLWGVGAKSATGQALGSDSPRHGEDSAAEAQLETLKQPTSPDM